MITKFGVRRLRAAEVVESARELGIPGDALDVILVGGEGYVSYSEESECAFGIAVTFASAVSVRMAGPDEFEVRTASGVVWE